MRRFFSISLLLLFLLGPLADVLPASAEAQLPMCCRRHGAHHCMGMDEQATSGSPVVRAPSRCPLCPQAGVATVGAQFALVAEAGDVHAPAVEAMLLMHSCVRVRTLGARTKSDRGPPTATLA
jgi:hypothetical protein